MRNNNLGGALKAYRVAHLMSVREFAERLELSKATISRIERGHQIDGKTLIRVLLWLFDA